MTQPFLEVCINNLCNVSRCWRRLVLIVPALATRKQQHLEFVLSHRITINSDCLCNMSCSKSYRGPKLEPIYGRYFSAAYRMKKQRPSIWGGRLLRTRHAVVTGDTLYEHWPSRQRTENVHNSHNFCFRPSSNRFKDRMAPRQLARKEHGCQNLTANPTSNRIILKCTFYVLNCVRVSPNENLWWPFVSMAIWRGLISLCLYKEKYKLWDWKKNVFTLHIPRELHTLMTSF
jgi:hypothetical protein